MCLVLAALFGGCGGDGDGGSSKEVGALRIELFQSDIRHFCSAGRNALDGAADPLGTVMAAVDNLIKIYREDPEATYRLARIAKTGDKAALRDFSIRELLEQSIETLERGCGKYGPDQARRLQDTLRS